jgi:hypothetical protein
VVRAHLVFALVAWSICRCVGIHFEPNDYGPPYHPGLDFPEMEEDTPFNTSRFPGSGDAHAVAVRQQLVLPGKYSVGTCPRALIKSSPSITVSCNSAQPSDAVVVDRDCAVAYHFPHNFIFQHDMINGLSIAGLLTDWVRQDAASRAFLCSPRLCEILRALDWVTPENIVEVAQVPNNMFFRSIRLAYVKWHDGSEPVTFYSYPIGSSFPVLAYVSKTFAGVPPQNTLLFLSRGGPGSKRYIVNEHEVVAALSSWASLHGVPFQNFPHNNVPLDAKQRQEQQALFYHAKYVVGLHGGSFSNIVYCNTRATVIEINSCHMRRDCFATMAVIRGLNYVRFCPHSHVQYDGLALTMTPVDIASLLQQLTAVQEAV